MIRIRVKVRSRVRIRVRGVFLRYSETWPPQLPAYLGIFLHKLSWVIVCTHQWHSQGRGCRGQLSPCRNSAPPLAPPNEITLCTEVYGEPPFWVPVSPPPPRSLVRPPCCPLILKSLAMPLVLTKEVNRGRASLFFVPSISRDNNSKVGVF